MKNLSLLVTLLICSTVQAQVVKCKGEHGRIVYSDRVCPVGFSASSVNLSGANITDDQVRAAKARTANQASGENCLMIKNLADQTFASFLDNPNVNRWNASFQSLQNLASLCPSTETCGTIKTRIGNAQQRFNEDNKAVRGGHLNSVTALYANTCDNNGNAKQIAGTRSPNADVQPTTNDTTASSHFYTKDEFGNVVRSDKCYRTPDVFGVLRRSAGCK